MRRRQLTDEELGAAYRRDGRRLLVWLTRRTYDAQLAVDLVGEPTRGMASLSETGARSSRRFAALPTDSRALASARLPAGMRVLVASVPGAPEVLGVTATDAQRDVAGERVRVRSSRRLAIPGMRYVVWTGGDGTPHVQPVPAAPAPPGRGPPAARGPRERRAGHARGGRLPGRCDRGRLRCRVPRAGVVHGRCRCRSSPPSRRASRCRSRFPCPSAPPRRATPAR